MLEVKNISYVQRGTKKKTDFSLSKIIAYLAKEFMKSGAKGSLEDQKDLYKTVSEMDKQCLEGYEELVDLLE